MTQDYRHENRFRNKALDAHYDEVEKELDRLKNQRGKTQEELDEEEKPVEEIPEKVKTPVVPEEEKVDWKKRYGDLQRFHQSEKARLEAEITKVNPAEPPSNLSDTEFEEWLQKYPVVSAAINRLADQVATKKIDEKLSNYKDNLEYVERVRQKNDFELALAKIKEAHSDFDEIKTAPEFIEWLDEQDLEDQDAIRRPKTFDENAAKKAIRVIRLFKSETGWKVKKPTPTKKSTSGTDIVTKTKSTSPDDLDTTPRFTESMIEQNSRRDKRWFEKNRDAIREAQRKGPPYFIYDLSGAGN